MSRRRTGLVRTIGVIAALAAFTGCESTSSDGPSSAISGELTVLAAASLAPSFDELAGAFTAANPAVTVKPIVYDGSSTLATQLIEGASADVFATADERTMTEVVEAGDLSGAASVFATNTLQIAVEPGNPQAISGLADLARDRLLVVLCAPEVPCGAASHNLLDLAEIQMAPVSEEQNVTAVLTKVKAGEADAGLVYQTDIKQADGAVEGVAIEGSDRVINNYAIGVPARAANSHTARAFVDWVLSDDGQAILRSYGFGAP